MGGTENSEKWIGVERENKKEKPRGWLFPSHSLFFNDRINLSINNGPFEMENLAERYSQKLVRKKMENVLQNARNIYDTEIFFRIFNAG